MLFTSFDGVSVPRLGYGTWQLRDGQCVEGVKRALAVGYRHIDTAQAYENEAHVGQGIRESGVPRDEIFLTTKIWRSNVGRGQLEASAARSLEKLGTDFVDLLLIHWPVPEVPLEETLQALARVQEKGMARLIGISNFPVDWLEHAEAILPGRLACNQVEYHPYLDQSPVLGWLRSRGRFLTAYSPIARGEAKADAVIAKIAEAHRKSPAQIILRWHLQQEHVVAIPKAADPKHLESNFDLWDFVLSSEEMAAIHALARPSGRMISPEWSPRWDEAA